MITFGIDHVMDNTRVYLLSNTSKYLLGVIRKPLDFDDSDDENDYNEDSYIKIDLRDDGLWEVCVVEHEDSMNQCLDDDGNDFGITSQEVVDLVNKIREGVGIESIQHK